MKLAAIANGGAVLGGAGLGGDGDDGPSVGPASQAASDEHGSTVGDTPSVFKISIGNDLQLFGLVRTLGIASDGDQFGDGFVSACLGHLRHEVIQGGLEAAFDPAAAGLGHRHRDFFAIGAPASRGTAFIVELDGIEAAGAEEQEDIGVLAEGELVEAHTPLRLGGVGAELVLRRERGVLFIDTDDHVFREALESGQRRVTQDFHAFGEALLPLVHVWSPFDCRVYWTRRRP